MRSPAGKRKSHRIQIIPLCLLLSATAAVSLSAQQYPTQSAHRDFRFEVASIRPTTRTGFSSMEALRAAHSFTSDRFKEEQACLACLAGEAFEIKHGYQMESPRWMTDEYFTLNATVPGGTTKADLPIMLQHLLEDRFALKYHHEARQMDGYELVVAKSGPKMTKSDGPPDPSAANGRGFDIKDDAPQFDKNSGPRQVYVESAAGLVSWWHGRDETMQRLASDISDRLRLPVVDATGLEERYDFSLNFLEEHPAGTAPPAGSDGASAPAERPLMRDALREQLGLELRPVKNLPIDVIVIDSANKQPTEN